MFQRLDKISVQGLKGQWTEAAIPFEVKVFISSIIYFSYSLFYPLIYFIIYLFLLFMIYNISLRVYEFTLYFYYTYITYYTYYNRQEIQRLD